MKTYSKIHSNKKAIESHIKKIEQRGGSVKRTGMKIEYKFPEKSSDNSINANSTVELIQDASKKGYRKAKIEYYPAYDATEHSDLPEKLKNTLKKPKIITVLVIEESEIILSGLKNKDVKSIHYV